MSVTLTAGEIAILFQQDPGKKNRGGWQSLMVGLQNKTDRTTGGLDLNGYDLERIPRYAFDYGNGGWEDMLVGVFGRVLGPRLGR